MRLSFPTITSSSAPDPVPETLTTGGMHFGYMKPGLVGVRSSCVFGLLTRLLHASN